MTFKFKFKTTHINLPPNIRQCNRHHKHKQQRSPIIRKLEYAHPKGANRIMQHLRRIKIQHRRPPKAIRALEKEDHGHGSIDARVECAVAVDLCEASEEEDEESEAGGAEDRGGLAAPEVDEEGSY